MRLLLENPGFRRLWLSNLLSLAGSQVSRIGLLLVVVDRTDSVPALALLVALETLPGALAAPVAGALVDRLSKRTVMVAADLARFAAVMVILAAPQYDVICAMAALQSIATAFFQPARASTVPALVDRNRIVAANSVDQAAMNLMFIVGPVLGTELLLNLGLTWTLLLDGATFLASAFLIRSIALPEPRGAPANAEIPSTFDDIRSGWRYLRDNQLVLHLSVLFFISLLCAGLWTPLAPFFIRDHLGASTRVLGWQFAAFGGGAVAGSLIAPAVVRRWGRGVVLFAGLLGEGLCQTTYAVVPDAAISTVLILGWGVVVSLIVVPFYSILQTVVDERFIGRVFAAVRQSENIALALAMGAAVLLQGRMDSSSILLLGGVAYCALALGSSFTGGGRALLATR